MGVAIRDWIKYNKGRKLFEDCKYKGTFFNCNSGACIQCHKEVERAIIKHYG